MTNIINRDEIARARDAGREEADEALRVHRDKSDPLHFLRRETLVEHCKGDPANLPVFVAHNDWPRNKARVDSKGRIHINRTALMDAVWAAQLPIKLGLWLGPVSQEMRINLTAEQLGGGSTSKHEAIKADFRALIGTDRETGKAVTDD